MAIGHSLQFLNEQDITIKFRGIDSKNISYRLKTDYSVEGISAFKEVLKHKKIPDFLKISRARIKTKK